MGGTLSLGVREWGEHWLRLGLQHQASTSKTQCRTGPCPRFKACLVDCFIPIPLIEAAGSPQSQAGPGTRLAIITPCLRPILVLGQHMQCYSWGWLQQTLKGASFYHTTLQDCPCELSSRTVLMDPAPMPTLPSDFRHQVSTHNSRPHSCPGTSQFLWPKAPVEPASRSTWEDSGAESRTTPADEGLQRVTVGQGPRPVPIRFKLKVHSSSRSAPVDRGQLLMVLLNKTIPVDPHSESNLTHLPADLDTRLTGQGLQ